MNRLERSFRCVKPTHPGTGRALGVLILAALLTTNSSCTNVSRAVQDKFDSLEPGMSVTQISAVLGNPDNLVGEVTTIYGQHVVVWEYEKLTEVIVLPSGQARYWVYLVDGKFCKYTPVGDWQSESKIIRRTDYSELIHPSAH